MATEPTIEGVAAAKAAIARWFAETSAGYVEDAPDGAIRTLLASHASLEERVKEAKRLMTPFVKPILLDFVKDYEEVSRWPKAGDLRALAAFVNEKET